MDVTRRADTSAVGNDLPNASRRGIDSPDPVQFFARERSWKGSREWKSGSVQKPRPSREEDLGVGEWLLLLGARLEESPC